MRHPIQRVEKDENGRPRFRCNLLVEFLLDYGPFNLNDLACLPVPRGDNVQFAQLIGYSVSGFSELSYVADGDYARAEEAMKKARKAKVEDLKAYKMTAKSIAHSRGRPVCKKCDGSGKCDDERFEHKITCWTCGGVGFA